TLSVTSVAVWRRVVVTISVKTEDGVAIYQAFRDLSQIAESSSSSDGGFVFPVEVEVTLTAAARLASSAFCALLPLVTACAAVWVCALRAGSACTARSYARSSTWVRVAASPSWVFALLMKNGRSASTCA